MKEKNKNLLLKDILGRLPYYNFRVRYGNKNYTPLGYGVGRIQLLDSPVMSFVSECPLVEHVKPYLRPMSSMTDDERKELSKILNYEFYIDDDFALVAEDDRHRIRLDLLEVCIDWLNEHMFDYRDLIEKGLALEAPHDMY